MSPEMIDLARRAVACKGWRWMPGMLAADGPWWGRVGCGFNWREDAEVLPDLSDAATLGCVLALVREVWGDPTAHFDGYGVWIRNQNGEGWRAPVSGFGPFNSEAEALVAALEQV